MLATDGVWDFLTDQEVVDIVKSSVDKNKASNAVVEAALQRAALESYMTVEQLKTLPAGNHRRSRHDDTTAVVMFL